MTSGVGLTSWQIIGAIAAFAMVLATFFASLWLRKRQREERNQRPPQEAKLLRPAGYYAMCQVDLLMEKCTGAIFQAISAGIIFGLTGGTFFPLVAGLASGRFTISQARATPNSSVFIVVALTGTIALLWAVRSLQIAWKHYDKMRNHRFGMRGEQAVAEELMDRELAAAGYKAFHDLPAEKGRKKWNVDHIVVGPGGLFILETKTRPRRRAKWEQDESHVIFDGKVLQFPWCYDRRAVRQARYNASWVRKYLGAYAPGDLRIYPIIVVPGWFVPKYDERFDVKVMNARYLVEHLKRAARLYSEDDLKTVIQRLDDGCRTLEF